MATSNIEDLQRARTALTKFLTLMHKGEYGEATKYYGGSYDVLQNWNPPVDKNDHAALLEAGCKYQLGCFAVRRVTSEKQLSQDTFALTVEFTDTDGDLYVRGPLPGDRFLVQDLPPMGP